jgi:DNA-binding beta-propeller fold protein YncE
MSVIDGASCDAAVTSGCGQTPPTVTVGLGPLDVAVDQRTDTVYVVNIKDFSVTVVDGNRCNATHSSGCRLPFRTVQVGGLPIAVEANSATHTAYVANYFDNNASVLGSR